MTTWARVVARAGPGDKNGRMGPDERTVREARG
jgi:hypothetical protein